jgi:hypothetical protein
MSTQLVKMMSSDSEWQTQLMTQLIIEMSTRIRTCKYYLNVYAYKVMMDLLRSEVTKSSSLYNLRHLYNTYNYVY